MRPAAVTTPDAHRHADHPSLHPRRAGPLRRPHLRPADLPDRQPERLGRLRDEGRAGAGGVVAGRGRHPRAEVLPPGRRAGAARRASPRTACPSGCSGARPAPDDAASAARPTPGRCSAAWPAAGPTGAGRAATSRREADARAFFDETCYMLAAQMAAPNSPQWFNTGLHWAYGIEGPPQGHYYVDPQTGRDERGPRRPTSARPRTPASSSRSPTTW